ncbi:DinB family protein [Shouchella hunanensis]|uniref:DinB family protein n=1 Tax=Shouchella hunanensis TaxID=766894 RepID=A0ABY7W2H6_9BACI|nr:DinB family protein [Shouchella hunanensis]WDF02251.1 DinB family protein [Shouchella hunanensis]
MNAVSQMKETAFHELEVGIRSIEGLLHKVREDDYSYRPSEQMRTLEELMRHLVAIPEVDLCIMQEQTQEQVQQIEKKYNSLPTSQAMVDEMYKGLEAYKTYVFQLSDEDFLTKKTTAFYLEKGTTQIQWLMEVVTHVFHHRAQLFTYLKQKGYEVTMFDLYV